MPPKRERDRYKITTVALNVLILIVLAFQGWTLYQTVEISRNDQRAWVGAVDVSFPDVREGSALHATVLVTNSGRSPARNVEHDVCYNIGPAADLFTPTYARTEAAPPSISVLQPGAQVRLPVYRAPLTQQQAEDILSGQQTLYVFGRISYEDVFNTPHETTFGYSLVPSLSGWRHTNTYNTAD